MFTLVIKHFTHQGTEGGAGGMISIPGFSSEANAEYEGRRVMKAFGAGTIVLVIEVK